VTSDSELRGEGLASRLLMTLQVVVSAPHRLGGVPHGTRVIAPIAGGSFEGPRLRGKVLPDGSDWTLLRSDGVLELDLRITLEADDGALIYMNSVGLRHGPPEMSTEPNEASRTANSRAAAPVVFARLLRAKPRPTRSRPATAARADPSTRSKRSSSDYPWTFSAEMCSRRWLHPSSQLPQAAKWHARMRPASKTGFQARKQDTQP